MAKPVAENIALRDLKAAIRSGEVNRLYFFHGEETYLLNYYLEQLRKLLVDEVTESFNYHKLTIENFDIQSFADSVENLPMMAEHTFVWVDEIDLFKQPEDMRKKFQDVLTDIPDYCTVVFTYVTTSWKPDKRLKEYHDALMKSGTVVEFPKQEPRELIPWITRHFAARKKQITPQLCTYLIDLTGGTMTTLISEIEKIAAFSGADAVCKADIDAVCEPVLDAVTFQMTDLMGEGRYGEALLKLQELLKMQQDPLLILGTIGAHFRKIGAARILSENGKGAGDLMSMYKMGDYAARKTMAAATKFSARFCKKAAELIMETDIQLKSAGADEEKLMELLVLNLTQEARNG